MLLAAVTVPPNNPYSQIVHQQIRVVKVKLLTDLFNWYTDNRLKWSELVCDAYRTNVCPHYDILHRMCFAPRYTVHSCRTYSHEIMLLYLPLSAVLPCRRCSPHQWLGRSVAMSLRHSQSTPEWTGAMDRYELAGLWFQTRALVLLHFLLIKHLLTLKSSVSVN